MTRKIGLLKEWSYFFLVRKRTDISSLFKRHLMCAHHVNWARTMVIVVEFTTCVGQFDRAMFDEYLTHRKFTDGDEKTLEYWLERKKEFDIEPTPDSGGRLMIVELFPRDEHGKLISEVYEYVDNLPVPGSVYYELTELPS